MITLTRRKFENGSDVRLFEKRIILENFRVRCAGGQEIQDVLDPYAQRPDARTSPALLWINGDAVQFAHEVDSFSTGRNFIIPEFSDLRHVRSLRRGKRRRRRLARA